MTIEDRIREIALAPIKEGDSMVVTTDEYFYNLCVKAFNLGLDVASENAKTATYVDGYSYKEIVDKDSILKLKIK